MCVTSAIHGAKVNRHVAPFGDRLNGRVNRNTAISPLGSTLSGAFLAGFSRASHAVETWPSSATSICAEGRAHGATCTLKSGNTRTHRGGMRPAYFAQRNTTSDCLTLAETLCKVAENERPCENTTRRRTQRGCRHGTPSQGDNAWHCFSSSSSTA